MTQPVSNTLGQVGRLEVFEFKSRPASAYHIQEDGTSQLIATDDCIAYGASFGNLDAAGATIYLRSGQSDKAPIIAYLVLGAGAYDRIILPERGVYSCGGLWLSCGGMKLRGVVYYSD